MSVENNDSAYLADMIEAGNAVREYLTGMTLKTLVRDRMRCRAVEREFEILGEAARQLSVAFRERHPNLPLAKVIGLRNVIAHGYAEVDYSILFTIARDELPDLLSTLRQLLP